MTKNLKNKELLFFTAYFLWLGGYMLVKTTLYSIWIPNEIFSAIRFACIGLLLIKIYCYDRFYTKELLIIIAISVVTLFTILKSGDSIIGDILILILASKNIPFKSIVRFTLTQQCFWIFIVVSSSLLGIIENRVFLRTDGTLRNSFGFVYTTLLGVYFLHIVLMYLYVRGNKLGVLDNIVIFTLNYVVRIFTDSKTNFFLVIAVVILFDLFIKVRLKVVYNKLVKYLFIFSIPLCALISMVAILLYNQSNNYWITINSLLNYRLSLGKLASDIYGFHLFGQKITMIGSAAVYFGNYSLSDYFYIDSSYVQIALIYGLLFLILLCVGFYLLCNKEMKQGNISFCICVLILAIHSMIEPQLIVLSYNVFLFALREVFTVKVIDNLDSKIV